MTGLEGQGAEQAVLGPGYVLFARCCGVLLESWRGEGVKGRQQQRWLGRLGCMPCMPPKRKGRRPHKPEEVVPQVGDACRQAGGQWFVGTPWVCGRSPCDAGDASACGLRQRRQAAAKGRDCAKAGRRAQTAGPPVYLKCSGGHAGQVCIFKGGPRELVSGGGVQRRDAQCSRRSIHCKEFVIPSRAKNGRRPKRGGHAHLAWAVAASSTASSSTAAAAAAQLRGMRSYVRIDLGGVVVLVVRGQEVLGRARAQGLSGLVVAKGV